MLIPPLFLLSAVLATTDDPARPAVSKAVTFLQEEGVAWIRARNCASCHHGAMGIWALEEAKGKGMPVDEAALKELRSWTLSDPTKSKILPDPKVPPSGVNLAATYLVLAAPKTEGEETEGLSKLTGDLPRAQGADGSWSNPQVTRPPMLEDDETLTLWSVLALASRPDDSPEGQARLKGEAWLEKTPAGKSLQAGALRLLFKVRKSSPSDSIEADVNTLLARQRDDGGFGQESDMPSDAYATGQALYALGSAGRDASDPAVRRAREFLIKTQRDDGSWPMASRPASTSNKPSKDLDPITYAGTAWATLGLVRTGPK